MSESKKYRVGSGLWENLDRVVGAQYFAPDHFLRIYLAFLERGDLPPDVEAKAQRMRALSKPEAGRDAQHRIDTMTADETSELLGLVNYLHAYRGEN